MPKKNRDLKNWLEFFALQAFLWFTRIMPFSWSCWVGKQLGKMAYQVLTSRRQLTIENIREAQGQGFLTGINVNELACKVWENIGQVGSEFFYFYSRGFDALRKRVTISGEANLRQVLAQRKGAILIVAHLGNWELLGLALSALGYPLTPLVKTQTNPLVDRVIQAKRQSAGIKVVPRERFLRQIVLALRNNEIVPFLIDQSQAGQRGVRVQVFGRTASLPPGAAEFALKTGAPVIFAYLVREEGNRYRVVISEEIELSKTGDYAEDLVANTAYYIGMVQEVVTHYPEQWLWMHKLWESRIRV
ncbi:KDO2-lipid IV(A) lauroyltransferase [Hydrogenispora ethanolica]|jgi:KDO2-lipid IV(A) lauroyltransferase|uniref:KDO2-lipid IV(A) lauroyltransferase n=1 Tax=Hydrogenispora ethanolica TaxID=1082276 RepID=A0A4R1RFM9_HYDET|nr:lysophospholipid acyltransferase family protein [Hydrogenispora ethanolica]TCL64788.1 KDO2-lipid IV(A) lauroyltransferase [Hydrogenispora ethanolica]